jgi:hypothetical protein
VRIGGSASGQLLDAGSSDSGGGPGGWAFPLGALAALAVLGAIYYIGARFLRSPLGVTVPALSWLVVVAALMYGESSKGDVLLASTLSAEVFVYGGLLVAAVLLVLAYQWQLTDRLRAR